MKNRVVLIFLSLISIACGRIKPETLYQRLGVDPAATEKQIQDRCRRLMMDLQRKDQNDEETQEESQEVNNACEVLTDRAKGARYKNSLKKGRPAFGSNRGSTLAIEGPASQ